MTGEQSRGLQVGARVCWGEDQNDRGTVTAKNWSGVTLTWDNRDHQSVSHNDMKMVFLVPENEFMKKYNPKEAGTEVDCPACEGTGYPAVAQPKPGRRIFPGRCKQCLGKGRIDTPAVL